MLSDPFAEYIGSFSHDRSLRLYKVQNFKTSKLAKISKVISKLSFEKKSKETPPNHIIIEESNPISENINTTNQNTANTNLENKISTDISESENITQNIFIDSNKLEGLFQRADWSPCGWFFLVPSAQFTTDSDKKNTSYGSYMYSRTDFQKPLIFYPTENQVIIAKFSPCLYEAKTQADPNKIIEEGKQHANSPFDLPFDLSFILATYSYILVYSTKQVSPLFKLDSIHYAGFSDISWHCSGYHFCVSSLDGFITFGSLKSQDLGNVIPHDTISQNPNIYNKNITKRIEFLSNKNSSAQHIESQFKITNKVTFTRKDNRVVNK